MSYLLPAYYSPYLFSSYPYSYNYPYSSNYGYGANDAYYSGDVCDPSSPNYDPEYCARLSAQSSDNTPSYDPFVAEVQERLYQLGHYSHAHDQADGIYGPETIAAVRRFQKSRGLPVTGLLDGLTLSALGLKAPKPPQSNSGPQNQVPAADNAEPRISVPAGYKLVPVDSPEAVQQKFVVPEGYMLVPINPTTAPESQPVSAKDGNL